MRKLIFIMTFLLGIVSFSDNYFEGFWKINKPFEAEFLLEYKGTEKGQFAVKESDVYKVHVREKVNGKIFLNRRQFFLLILGLFLLDCFLEDLSV